MLETVADIRKTAVLPNDLGLTCASNMVPPGREVQAEQPGS
jgi:hypothetical protein